MSQSRQDVEVASERMTETSPLLAKATSAGDAGKYSNSRALVLAAWLTAIIVATSFSLTQVSWVQ
jgi:hypothetical protein